MKTTEIRYIPKTEQSRNLVYSEFSSRARSLHILLQDNSIEQYKFLLKAYREIIASYLSSQHLEPPLVFLSSLVKRFEGIYMGEGITIEDLRGMGFFLLFHDGGHFYILTSREERVHLRHTGQFTQLSEPQIDFAERLDLLEMDQQQELFPQHLQDIFTLFRIRPAEKRDVEILLGCSEKERAALLEAAQDNGSKEFHSFRELPLEFLSKKALHLRFGGLLSAGDATEVKDSRKSALSASFGKVHSAAIISIAVVVFIAAAIWLSSRFPLPPPESGDKILQAEQLQEPQAARVEAPSAVSTLENESVAATSDTKPAEVELRLIWKNTYPQPVTSSPAITERRVYFGCRDGKLYAVDRLSGEPQWNYTASGGIGASPAVQANRVIGADYSGAVFALDIDTGKRLWHQKLPAKIVSSPCIAGDNVLIGCLDGFAYCLSCENGAQIWKRQTKGRLRGSAAAAGERFFIPSYDGQLYALSAGTGSVLWSYNIEGEVMSSPVVSGDAVFVGGPDGRIHAVDCKSGELRWVFQSGGPIKSSVSASDGRILFGSHDFNLYCLDSGTGALLWKFKTGGFVLSRPRVVDGKVFFGSYDQIFYCLDEETGAKLDQFSTGGTIYSSAASFDHLLFFGNNTGEFFCLVYSDEETS